MTSSWYKRLDELGGGPWWRAADTHINPWLLNITDLMTETDLHVTETTLTLLQSWGNNKKWYEQEYQRCVQTVTEDKEQTTTITVD